MKKTKLFLKAVVIIGIALAFVMPGAAIASNRETINVNKQPYVSLPKLLGFEEGWVMQASGFWDPSRGIRFMDAVDENTAWAVGYDGTGGGVYETLFTTTSDGGELWTASKIIIDEGYGLGNICGLDGDTAWAAVFSTGVQDEKCGIYKTTNGGDSWVHQFEGPYSFANNVWFFDENEGVALGDQDPGGFFEIWTSDDGGDTWEQVPEDNFSGHEIVPGEYGWTGCMEAMGENSIIFGTHAPEGYAFISHDRGHTWFGEFTGCPGIGLNPGVNELAFKDPMNGIAAHDNGQTYDLFETSDGGVTWEEITPTGTPYASGLSFIPGTDNMYISTGGADPTSGASYSLDGGHSWTDYADVLGTQLLANDFVEGGIGWAGSFNDDEFTDGVYKYYPPPNLAPGAPEIAGEINGKAGVSYEYSFKSVDPDDDDIAEYIVDWGDNSGEETITGPFASGDFAYASHIWNNQGDYVITARAIDINDNVGPDGTLSISMPRNKAMTNTFFQWFFQQFPNAFPVLRYVLGL